MIRAPHRDCDVVRQWQQRLKDQGRQIDVDADYGPKSEQVCRSFQQEKGLEVDGALGPKTWAKSWSSRALPHPLAPRRDFVAPW